MAAAPHDVSTMTTVLVGVGASLLGVVLGGFIQGYTGWLTDKRKAKHDHDAWLRQERLSAFVVLAKAFTDILDVRITDTDRDDAARRYLDAEEAFHALVPASLMEKWVAFLSAISAVLRSHEYNDVLREDVTKAYSTLRTQFRYAMGFNNDPVAVHRTSWIRWLFRRLLSPFRLLWERLGFASQDSLEID